MRHSNYKRTFACLLSVLLLTGCGGAQPLPEESEADSLISPEEELLAEEKKSVLPERFALSYAPEETLDPITCPDGVQQVVCSLLYEGLFRLSPEFEAEPWLCASYTYDAENLIYTLTLREDVLFSDGTPLTANDVEESLDRARESVRYGDRLSAITRVYPEDDITLTISLSTPNTALPALLDIPIVKDKTEKGSVPIGTGPYLFSVGETEDCLTANPNWWRGGEQPVEHIALVEASDTDNKLYRFSSREVQLITADLSGAASIGAGSVNYQDAGTTILQYLGCNTTRSPMSSAAFRRTLAAGIDRSQIVGGLLSGHAAAAQFPVSPSSPLYPAELETVYSHDSFLAAIEKLDYVPERPLDLLVNEENTFKISVAQHLAEEFSAHGIPTEVRVLPWAEYTAALAAGNFDLYYAEVKLSADWDLSDLLSVNGSLNYGRWVSASVDELMLSLASAADRAAAMMELCGHLQLFAPILPLCFTSTSVLMQSGVLEGLHPTATEPFYNLADCTVHLSTP